MLRLDEKEAKSIIKREADIQLDAFDKEMAEKLKQGQQILKGNFDSGEESKYLVSIFG